MSLHREEVKHLISQNQLSQLEAEKNKIISDIEKERQTLLTQLQNKEEALATMKTSSLQKTEVINNLTKGIEEWREKVANFNQLNAILKQEIAQRTQEVAQLTEDNKALIDIKQHLENSIAEVEMRAQMELMMEYKDGKHLSWDPDAVINDYHATFPDTSASPLEDEPISPPIPDDDANLDHNADDPPA